MGNLLVGDYGLGRMSGHEVGTAHHKRLRLFSGELGDYGANGNLDSFCRGFTNLNHVLLPQVVLDVRRKYVTGYADGFLLNDTAK